MTEKHSQTKQTTRLSNLYEAALNLGMSEDHAWFYANQALDRDLEIERLQGELRHKTYLTEARDANG